MYDKNSYPPDKIVNSFHHFAVYGGQKYDEFKKSRESVIQNYSLNFRYRLMQFVCLVVPFRVKRRSFRAFAYTLMASSYLICPELFQAMFFDHDKQMFKQIEVLANENSDSENKINEDSN